MPLRKLVNLLLTSILLTGLSESSGSRKSKNGIHQSSMGSATVAMSKTSSNVDSKDISERRINRLRPDTVM